MPAGVKAVGTMSGYKKLVAKNMILNFIQSLKQKYLEQQLENLQTEKYMSKVCLHNISDFFETFFNIKNL